MDRASIEREVATFVAARAHLAPPPASDLDLVGSGLLDSLLLVELVMFVEDRFGVTPSLDELEVENFATVGRVAEFVAARRSE